MAVTIAACRTLTAARPLALASRGQLVQVAGDALELGHEVQLFAGDPRPNCSAVDQLAQHFGRRLSSLTAKGRKAEFPLGTEPRADDVFADAADTDFRTPALFAICFLRCYHDR